MKLDPTKIVNPERPIYVLLHEDESHVYATGNGEACWSHETSDLELIRKILKEDFKVCKYHIVERTDALIRIGNLQAMLVKLWTPCINSIRKTRDLETRRELYSNFRHKHKAPHPIEADAMLKRLLKW